MMSYEDKVRELQRSIGGLPGAIVAFSGGVDSTALLWAALEQLGAERVIAVTASSPSFPAAEEREATELAREFGVQHRLLKTEELARDGYRRNEPDRCYFCKTELFDAVAERIRAADLPPWPILYGAIADDWQDHRPGQRAATERGVQAPLAEARFTKQEVRRYSRERSLPTAAKPSFACLASRIPYGTPVERALLRKLEQAEDYLRQRGFRQFRVRHHGASCRIELPVVEIERAAGPERAGIVEHMKGLGYAYVTLDLQGFRSGSMNEVWEQAGGSGRGGA